MVALGDVWLQASKLDPESDLFLQKTYYFLNKEEKKIFNNLSTVELRREFINAFWEIRNPNPGSAVNEFEKEIDTRFEYVQKRFRERGMPGWETDRGRFYMLLGAPEIEDRYRDYADTGQSFNAYSPDVIKEVIIWSYNKNSEIGGTFHHVRFDDNDGLGVFRLNAFTLPLEMLNMLDEARDFYLSFTKTNTPFCQLKFKISYDPEAGGIVIVIDPKTITYENQNSETVLLKLRIAMLIFTAKGNIEKRSEEKVLPLLLESLLRKGSSVKFTLPMDMQPGKVRIDIHIRDMQNNAYGRQVITVKIPKRI